MRESIAKLQADVAALLQCRDKMQQSSCATKPTTNNNTSNEQALKAMQQEKDLAAKASAKASAEAERAVSSAADAAKYLSEVQKALADTDARVGKAMHETKIQVVNTQKEVAAVLAELKKASIDNKNTQKMCADASIQNAEAQRILAEARKTVIPKELLDHLQQLERQLQTEVVTSPNKKNKLAVPAPTPAPVAVPAPAPAPAPAKPAAAKK